MNYYGDRRLIRRSVFNSAGSFGHRDPNYNGSGNMFPGITFRKKSDFIAG